MAIAQRRSSAMGREPSFQRVSINIGTDSHSEVDAERKHGSIEWNRSCETRLFLSIHESSIRRNIRVVTGDDDRGGNRLCREWELIPPWGIGGAGRREREEEEESAEK